MNKREIVNENTNKLLRMSEVINSLEIELKGLLDSEDITNTVVYQCTNNFVNIPMLVTTENLVAAITRELEILKKQKIEMVLELESVVRGI